MIRVKFDCKGHNAPAYSCDKPGDNSGEYIQATDVDELLDDLQGVSCMGELNKLLRQYGRDLEL